ncbi:MAG TPA: hypothetical protein VIP48_18990 [Streptosporangiaceae bacterium]
MLSHRPAARLGLTGALAGALAVTGCAASAASTGATAAAPSHTAHLMVYSINSDGPDFQAIVTGAIGDYGPAQTVFGNGQVDPSHTHDLELKLTRGSFKLSITGLDKKFTAVTSHEPIYPRTCSDYLTASAPMPVVPGSGTGAYRGISGRFTVTITGDEVERTPCQPDAGFRWQALVLRGPGRVSVG